MVERVALSHRPARGLMTTILGGWALAALVLLLASATTIANLRFPDPDDAMRMLEVRDWLGGQGWFDVAQHRLNHGDFPMHWSRLVDLPLATMMLLLDPVLGTDAGTRVTMTVMPLLTLLAIMALAALLTRRLAGQAVAKLAVLIVPLSSPILYQARPLRIDHHGWQIALALTAAWLMIGRPTARRGALTGLVLATLLTISLEGMPIAASIAGVAAIGWAVAPARRDFLLALAWTLFGVATALHVATRGPAMWTPACDAMAPMWLLALGVAALGVSAATLSVRFGVAARLAALALAGLATAAVPVLVAPGCLAGPFATLPPNVYEYWYLMVLEGRPLWEQSPYWALMTIGLPVAGLIGTVRCRQSTRGRLRERWTILLALLVSASVVAIFVNRAGATANAFAVPGAAALVLGLLTRARAIRPVGRRTLATAGALLLASPGQAAGMALMITEIITPAQHRMALRNPWHRTPCDYSFDLRVLDTLPAGLVFAPIDVSPELIATTHQRAISGGYHRNAAAMNVVMIGFAAPPDKARAAIMASGADYLAACPGFNELELYRKAMPDGLWARLERGERFAWLRPIPLKGSPALAWRIIRPLPKATPHP